MLKRGIQMAITQGVPKLTIRYSGIFDFDGLYNLIIQWMKARRFWVMETKYKHKVPSPAGAEQEITFKGDKEVTEFYKEELAVDMHLWDMTEVEVEVAGVKKTLTNARIQIELSGKLIVDEEGIFAKPGLGRLLGDFYAKYVIKKDIDTWGDELYYRMNKLHEAIKKFIDMYAKGSEYVGYLGEA
jgi:hypothetical protein